MVDFAETLGDKIMLRWKQMKRVKEPYDDRDYQIARYVNPRRELIKDSQKFSEKGSRRGKDAYAGEPSSALSVWCDGMQGHMVSKSLKWFKSVTNNFELNKIDEVQRYLQEYDEAMYGEFGESNFYDVLPEWFRDAGSVGTATLYSEEDMGRGVSVHTPIHPREIYISENRYGLVDTVFRNFFLTARQAVEKFDNNRLDDHIKKDAREHPEKRHEFIHAVYPNEDRMFGSLLSKHKRYASVYVQVSGSKVSKKGNVVKESGYDINPYAVWRLRKNSDEIYGYSPAADAMVSIIKLNQMGKTLLKAAHLSVSPSLNVPQFMRGNTRIEPDGHNYYEKGGDLIKPIQTGNNYPIAIDREDKIQRIIEDAYRVEFFLILARAEREMTATEIMERQSEKSVLLGPQVDRMENEGLRKKFDIVSDIADKNGRLPEPPQVLIDALEESRFAGKKLKINIRFIGPLAQAQRRLFQMQPIKNGMNELAQASVVWPTVLDRVDPDRLAERILDNTDFPQDVMRTDDELREYREEQALERQKMEAMQAAEAMAEGYKKTTKAPEEGSPAEIAMGAL
jgi:hypothetical protein